MFSTTDYVEIGKNKEFKVFTSRLIGQGAQGKVYDSSFQPEKPLLPICTKVTNFGRLHIQNEQKILQRLQQYQNNLNIVKIFYVCHDILDNNLYVVMEKCSTTLEKELNIKEKFTFKEIEAFVQQFVIGYQPLYQNKIVHLDIKPENILFHQNQYKISDFGIGQFYDNNQIIIRKQGTPMYSAPEINRLHHDPSLDQSIKLITDKSVCDMYSLGVMLHKMAFGDFPYKANEQRIKDFLQEIKIRPFKINKSNISTESDIFLIQTIEQMLIYDPKDRLTFDKLNNLVQSRRQNQARQTQIQIQKPSEFQNYLESQLRIYFQEVKEFLKSTLNICHNQFKVDVQQQGFWNQQCHCIFELFPYNPFSDQYNTEQLSFFVSLYCLQNRQIYPFVRNRENMKSFLLHRMKHQTING